MQSVYLLSFIMLFFLTSSVEGAFAATYDINMPTGSASPDAPFFWQNEKTGEATGDIEISIGDTVVWKNGDQAKHTITSGTIEDGPDGKFGGADFLVPGEFYKFTFSEKGRFPYFCLIHPWMTGVVTVTNGYKIVPDVGKTTGDGLSVFNVDYQYSGILSEPEINEEQNSITFKITSDPKSLDQKLMLMLPPELIEGPYGVFVDGVKDLRFELTEDSINTIEIELPDNAKEITIVGTNVVPEFGFLSIAILGMAVFGTILFQRMRGSIKQGI